LKASAADYLDGESVDGELCQKILGAFDRAAYRAPKHKAAESILKRLKKLRAEVQDLEDATNQLGVDGFELFNVVDERLWYAEGHISGLVPEACDKRKKANPGNLAVQKALARSVRLGKTWQFTAALLKVSGRIESEWTDAYDQVRKVFERSKPSDANQ
jgi:hypothetical protein